MKRTAWLWLALVACADGETDDTATTPTEDSDEDLPAVAAYPTFDGDCPALVEGQQDFESEGLTRDITVRLPADPEGAGLIFAWHGNGGTGTEFDAYVGGANLARDLDAIVIFPTAGAGGVGVAWGVPPAGDPRFDMGLFDDLLACADQQFGVDQRRVFTSGFSAGALWSSYLVMQRAQYFAAAAIFSGGSDGTFSFNPYSTPAEPIPVLMTHGGRGDVVTVSFDQMTESMARQMRDDGATVIVCNHNGGHIVPAGYETWAWPFLDAHRLGVTPSPYADGADPSGALPSYCAWE